MRMERRNTDLLQPREYDCLRLLSAGLRVDQAASDLGISVSTFNKHLASARRKLGARRTSDALLVLERRRNSPNADGRDQQEKLSAVIDRSADLCNFADKLATCRTFDESWHLLRRQMQAYGYVHTNFGLVAEPFGQFTTGAKFIASTLPGELLSLYDAAGGADVDPIAKYISGNTRELFLDGSSFIKSHFAAAPKSMRLLSEAYLDNYMNRSLTVPCRDEATGAPHSLTVSFDPEFLSDFTRHRRHHVRTLKTVERAFWAHVQRKRLLTRFADISTRQGQALNYRVRGFKMPEVAEHMAVSLRFAEKSLAGARKRLRAPTTSSAIYRAMVYRVLD